LFVTILTPLQETIEYNRQWSTAYEIQSMGESIPVLAAVAPR